MHSENRRTIKNHNKATAKEVNEMLEYIVFVFSLFTILLPGLIFERVGSRFPKKAKKESGVGFYFQLPIPGNHK